MMIHAYPEIYLSKAQATLGETFDYAVAVCGLSGSEFVKLFLVSEVSKRMEHGEPAYLVGKSGIELVREILWETKNKEIQIEAMATFARSREYWIGWAVAYYQWYSNRKYGEIFKVLPFDKLEKMYEPLHEADITKFAEIADEQMRIYFSETNLKRIRTHSGLTQVKLAEQSGVNLRSIQMYEQRNKNINKASADTLYRLANVMGCAMEDLIEKI